MECTQRMEFTQELYESRSERICVEQIGFLGICGVKHPVKRGPNKIGRDPQTCSIVLNLNSISRQHAVINVLNQTEYMLMDLDSANKTKLMDKTLSPYIPHPLKNGDMVQFGEVFGVFRLLEEDTDLPMTQAIDMPETQIPETPISSRHVSKINKIPITTVPESPDVSDKDDSFIVPSQPKKEKCFRNSNSHFIKPSAKVISIQPVGTNKIDNIYWNSSKKSVSLNSQFNDSDSSVNDSTLSNKSSARQNNDKSIYEMETQAPGPCEADDSTDSIYTANTQVPAAISIDNKQVAISIHTASTQDPASIHTANTQVPAFIHNANTQIPSSIDNASIHVPASIHTDNTQAPCASPSIYSINTQLPPSANLPEVCKIDKQKDMQFDLCTSGNKQNNNDISNAETQHYNINQDSQDVELRKIAGKIGDGKVEAAKKLNVSKEEIIFEEFDCQDFDNGLESQALLPLENVFGAKINTSIRNQSNKKTIIKKTKKEVIIHSDSSTDCEDIDMLPTQKITAMQADDEDVTDCEDLSDDLITKLSKVEKPDKEIKNDNYEDMLTQIISNDDLNSGASKTLNKTTHDVNFEDMLTQVIVPEDMPTTSRINLEDMPTQIIINDCEDVIIAAKPISPIEDLPTQKINDKPTQNCVVKEFDSPFKIPLLSPLKAKRKDSKLFSSKHRPGLNKVSPIVIPDDDNYYAATQDILEDLCTQPDVLTNNVIKDKVGMSNNSDDDFLPSSVEDYQVGNKFPHLEQNLPAGNKTRNRSLDSSDGDDIVNNFVAKLSSQEIRDVIGVEPQVDKVRRVPSDISDVELTPKKVRPIKFMDIDLPNSQEIKTSVSMYAKTPVTESSSESEIEQDSEECTPILFRKKKKPKINAKIDLTKMFAAESLPTRVITRVRKPTNKFQNVDTKNLSRNILKPNFLTEQEDDIDKEIITENISRLKCKSEKSKNKETNKDSDKEIKTESKVKDESKLYEKENTNKLEEVDSKTDVAKNNKTEISDAKANKATKEGDNIDTAVTVKTISKKSKNNKTIEKVTKKESNKKFKEDNKLTVNADVLEDFSKDTKDSQVTNVTIETSIDSKSTRSSRNKRKDNKPNEKCSVSVEENSQKDKRGKASRKQNIKETIEIDLTDDVVEIRRSRRQPKPTKEVMESKEKTEKRKTKSLETADNDISTKPPPRRGRPPRQARTVKAEQSTIYSLTSDSDSVSPKSILKRPASENLDPPSPKRTRSAVKPNASLRATPARMNKTHYVLFTAFPCEEVKAKLEKLGAVVVTDVSACSIVLTLAVKRTFKLLCAVGLGRPIVGPAWVQACVDTNTIVDPWLYILKDEIAEKRFSFSLEKTLIGKRNFLNGFNVSSTPSVMPNTAEMKLIVECSGGTWKADGPQWICVSCSADKSLWPGLKRKGAIVVSTEFILGGVLRQRAEIISNKFC